MDTVDTVEKTESNDSESSLDYEAKASELGWVPKEKFRGDPAKHVDAKTYWEKGELVLPIVKQQREEAKKEAAELRKQLAEVKGTMSDFQKFTEEAAERKYKAEVAELRAAKAAAVEAGDKIAYQRADDALEEIKEAKPQPVKTEPKQDVGDPEFVAEFKDWVSKNEWYEKDPDKKIAADQYGIYYTNVLKMSRSEVLKAVSKKMAEMESEASGTERAGPQRGGKGSGPSTKAKTFDNLLPEYKQAFARFERNGMKMTKEAYLSKCDPDAWGA